MYQVKTLNSFSAAGLQEFKEGLFIQEAMLKMVS